MTEGDFLGNSNSAASLTNSIYATYREGSTYETTGSWIGDLCSDNALRGSSMSDGGGTIYNNGTNQFQNLSGLTGSSAFLNWLWLNAYTGIGRANTALRTIDTFEGLAPRQKEILQGEACFNRAWFYFVVLKLWGKGPIVPLETLSGAEQAALKISEPHGAVRHHRSRSANRAENARQSRIRQMVSDLVVRPRPQGLGSGTAGQSAAVPRRPTIRPTPCNIINRSYR